MNTKEHNDSGLSHAVPPPDAKCEPLANTRGSKPRHGREGVVFLHSQRELHAMLLAAAITAGLPPRPRVTVAVTDTVAERFGAKCEPRHGREGVLFLHWQREL